MMVRERKKSSGIALLSQQFTGLSELHGLNYKLVVEWLGSQPMRTWVSSQSDVDITNISSLCSQKSPTCLLCALLVIKAECCHKLGVPMLFLQRIYKGEKTKQLQILGTLESVSFTLKLLQSFADAGIPSSGPRHRIRLTWVFKKKYHNHL